MIEVTVKGGVLAYITLRGILILETPLNVMQSGTTPSPAMTSELKHIIYLTPLVN